MVDVYVECVLSVLPMTVVILLLACFLVRRIHFMYVLLPYFYFVHGVAGLPYSLHVCQCGVSLI